MPSLLPEIDPLLETRLNAVARPRREFRLHRLSALRWASVGLVALVFVGLRWTLGIGIGWAFPVLLVLMAGTVLWNWRESRRTPLDLDEAARTLEARHPDLQLTLQTALEQRAEGGKFNFLQRRVISQALQHADRHHWAERDPALSRWKTLHLAAMCGSFALLVGVAVSEKKAPGRPLRLPLAATVGVTVTPGNAEAERRSIVVVTARFGGALPKTVQLHWRPADGEPQTDTMAKSLSDPVFAFSLPPLMKETTYQISYDGKTTAEFKLTPFDLPALVRADATLTYPEYTHLAPRTIAETRRVSAVEGTELSYAFSLNKPVRRAVLKEANEPEIELVSSNSDRTRFTTAFRIEKSRRFTLLLEDQQGRTNRSPEEIRVEAVINQPPQIRWISPVGDPRVSPIEEVHLQAEARDDFGLVDYGMAISLDAAEPEFVSLKGESPTSVEAKFEHRLSLEARKAEPDQLITWFAWADDFGPDGKPRRTTGDLHFADVRPLDEIFREDDSGGGGPQGSSQQRGQQSQELIELQRQISIALWKLKQNEPAPAKRKEDLNTLEQSQRHVRQQLQENAGRIKEPKQSATAEKAKTFMDRVLQQLADAAKTPGSAALTKAWSASQGAYQELLKLQPKETRVAQQNSRSGRSGRQGANQRQLNQLEFKQNDSRYETETEAQPMTTPQQREQLQALSKLRELARRQNEVNQRLQELQTALTAAADEAQREQVRRELKRLEEEQRRLLADTDELRERMDRLPPGAQNQQTREQLDQTRENMRRSGERLERGEVSPALAEGSRAAEGLENLRENFRRESSSQFSEQLREARREAREIGEKQKEAEKKLAELSQGSAKSLDDREPREDIARTLEEQRAARDKLLNTLRSVAEDSETSEPGLHRRLYDLLRQQGQNQTNEQLQAGAEMLRRGFLPQAQDAATRAGQDLQQLQNGVERAAESVLGDEAAELRYAQQELDDLSKQLQRERRTGDEPGQSGEAAGEKSEEKTDSSALAGGDNPGDQKDRAPSQKADGKERASGANTPSSDEGSQTSGSAIPATTARNGSSPTAGTDPTNSGKEDPNSPNENSSPGSSGGGRGESRSMANNSGQSRPTSQNPGPNPEAQGPRSANSAAAGGQRGTRGNRDRGGQRGGGGGGGNESGEDNLSGMNALIDQLSQESGGGEESRRPLTGDGFNDWFERLRTVEELTQLPEARQRVASAREKAEALRREFKRHSQEPQWGVVDSGIAAPLAQARVLLRQELARRENPEALQPVDRDPVPDNYAESVRKYYEALGR